MQEAVADGSSVLDYYNSPMLGTPLPLAAQSGTSWDVSMQPNPLVVCTALISRAKLSVKYLHVLEEYSASGANVLNPLYFSTVLFLLLDTYLFSQLTESFTPQL